MMRREFSRALKAEMIRRASNAKGEIFCEGCGLNVTGKAIDFDHTIPEALFLDKSRPLTAKDGRLLGKRCCHDPKTVIDKGVIAKASRLELRRAGSRSAGWPKSKWRRKVNGQTVLR